MPTFAPTIIVRKDNERERLLATFAGKHGSFDFTRPFLLNGWAWATDGIVLCRTKLENPLLGKKARVPKDVVKLWNKLAMYKPNEMDWTPAKMPDRSTFVRYSDPKKVFAQVNGTWLNVKYLKKICALHDAKIRAGAAVAILLFYGDGFEGLCNGLSDVRDGKPTYYSLGT